jgi:energy-coupling factor transport system ATP-binding protein
MNEAVEADRIIVMNRGEIIADGTPKEIFSEVERLKSVSLAVPQVTELLYQLEQDGHNLPRGIIHAMDAADVLCAFIGGQE